MSGPFLIGRRVQLRPLEDEDAPILAAWRNDPEFRQYLLARFPTYLQDEREWLASLRPGKGTPRDVALGIELKQGRKLIGSVGLHMIDWVQRRAMTGSGIGPPAMRGKGYGTEAKTLLLDYAFGELGLKSIWAFVLEGNEASIQALHKQGYRQGGIFRQSTLVFGEWKNEIYFDILREEWVKLRAAKEVKTPARR